MKAVYGSNIDMARLLLDKGANASAVSKVTLA